MKLCDVCFKRGDTVKSVGAVHFQNTEEIFDLCESCSQILRELCNGNLNEKENRQWQKNRPQKPA